MDAQAGRVDERHAGDVDDLDRRIGRQPLGEVRRRVAVDLTVEDQRPVDVDREVETRILGRHGGTLYRRGPGRGGAHGASRDDRRTRHPSPGTGDGHGRVAGRNEAAVRRTPRQVAPGAGAGEQRARRRRGRPGTRVVAVGDAGEGVGELVGERAGRALAGGEAHVDRRPRRSRRADDDGRSGRAAATRTGGPPAARPPLARRRPRRPARRASASGRSSSSVGAAEGDLLGGVRPPPGRSSAPLTRRPGRAGRPPGEAGPPDVGGRRPRRGRGASRSPPPAPAPTPATTRPNAVAANAAHLGGPPRQVGQQATRPVARRPPRRAGGSRRAARRRGRRTRTGTPAASAASPPASARRTAAIRRRRLQVQRLVEHDRGVEVRREAGEHADGTVGPGTPHDLAVVGRGDGAEQRQAGPDVGAAPDRHLAERQRLAARRRPAGPRRCDGRRSARPPWPRTRRPRARCCVASALASSLRTLSSTGSSAHTAVTVADGAGSSRTVAAWRAAPAVPAPVRQADRPVFTAIARGEGALVWDTDGNEYVDAMASLWYCAAGHGRAEIADAVADAAAHRSPRTPASTRSRTGRPTSSRRRLAELTPIPDARVFLCGSGSEAVDTAMKLARLAQRMAGHPERTLIISRERGYHGTNLGGTSAQGIAPNREGWGPLVPDVVQVPSDDSEALAALMAEHGGRGRRRHHRAGAGRRRRVPAGRRLPRRAAPAVRPPRRVARLRRGDHRASGASARGSPPTTTASCPDLTTFAKAVTSGYQPLGGVLVGAAVRGPLESDPAFILRHGYTYSGPPGRVRRRPRQPRRSWSARRSSSGPCPSASASATACRRWRADGTIDHARGDGAVWAAGLRPDQDAMAIRDRMLAGGVITRAIGTDTLTFCPPLVTTDEQIDRIVDVLAASAGAAERRRRRDHAAARPRSPPTSSPPARRRGPDRRRRASCRCRRRGGRRRCAPPSRGAPRRR